MPIVACTVAKAADIKYRKMQWRIYAKCRPLTSLGHQVGEEFSETGQNFELL